jgi:hypothetical protein
MAAISTMKSRQSFSRLVRLDKLPRGLASLSHATLLILCLAGVLPAAAENGHAQPHGLVISMTCSNHASTARLSNRSLPGSEIHYGVIFESLRLHGGSAPGGPLPCIAAVIATARERIRILSGGWRRGRRLFRDREQLAR